MADAAPLNTNRNLTYEEACDTFKDVLAVLPALFHRPLKWAWYQDTRCTDCGPSFHTLTELVHLHLADALPPLCEHRTTLMPYTRARGFFAHGCHAIQSLTKRHLALPEQRLARLTLCYDLDPRDKRVFADVSLHSVYIFPANGLKGMPGVTDAEIESRLTPIGQMDENGNLTWEAEPQVIV